MSLWAISECGLGCLCCSIEPRDKLRASGCTFLLCIVIEEAHFTLIKILCGGRLPLFFFCYYCLPSIPPPKRERGGKSLEIKLAFEREVIPNRLILQSALCLGRTGIWVCCRKMHYIIGNYANFEYYEPNINVNTKSLIITKGFKTSMKNGSVFQPTWYLPLTEVP